MPDDSKKTPLKKTNRHDKHEPKDQRKPRQSRPNTAPPAIPEKTEVNKDKMHNKKILQEPGPGFYKGLKRETDDILKITEESNAKYNSKEIQSNWKKYETPIDSYEEIEEQENMGADYEKLIQAPMSIGGHFQFKHEKSWDSMTGPSEYDMYFDIYSDNLGTAICTIPFYKRNDLDQSMFSEIDMSAMKNRAVKYKQKYYNDKSYTTPDLESLEKTTDIIILKACLSNAVSELTDDTSSGQLDINLTEIAIKEDSNESCVDKGINELKLSPVIKDINILASAKQILDVPDEIYDILQTSEVNIKDTPNVIQTKDYSRASQVKTTDPVVKDTKFKAADPEEAKKPVIESPEDLEKWLDDFLDS